MNFIFFNTSGSAIKLMDLIVLHLIFACAFHLQFGQTLSLKISRSENTALRLAKHSVVPSQNATVRQNVTKTTPRIYNRPNHIDLMDKSESGNHFRPISQPNALKPSGFRGRVRPLVRSKISTQNSTGRSNELHLSSSSTRHLYTDENREEYEASLSTDYPGHHTTSPKYNDHSTADLNHLNHYTMIETNDPITPSYHSVRDYYEHAKRQRHPLVSHRQFPVKRPQTLYADSSPSYSSSERFEHSNLIPHLAWNHPKTSKAAFTSYPSDEHTNRMRGFYLHQTHPEFGSSSSTAELQPLWPTRDDSNRPKFAYDQSRADIMYPNQMKTVKHNTGANFPPDSMHDKHVYLHDSGQDPHLFAMPDNNAPHLNNADISNDHHSHFTTRPPTPSGRTHHPQYADRSVYPKDVPPRPDHNSTSQYVLVYRLSDSPEPLGHSERLSRLRESNHPKHQSLQSTSTMLTSQEIPLQEYERELAQIHHQLQHVKRLIERGSPVHHHSRPHHLTSASSSYSHEPIRSSSFAIGDSTVSPLSSHPNWLWDDNRYHQTNRDFQTSTIDESYAANRPNAFERSDSIPSDKATSQNEALFNTGTGRSRRLNPLSKFAVANEKLLVLVSENSMPTSMSVSPSVIANQNDQRHKSSIADWDSIEKGRSLFINRLNAPSFQNQKPKSNLIHRYDDDNFDKQLNGHQSKENNQSILSLKSKFKFTSNRHSFDLIKRTSHVSKKRSILIKNT